MINPNQFSSPDNESESTKWDSPSEIEFAPISVSTNEVSKITLSDSPMGEGRQDKRVDVADASGMEKRTSNLMLGYNEKGVQIGETYLSVEEFHEAALKSLEDDIDDKVLYYVRQDTGKRFAEPREVVDDMLRAIAGTGPEVILSDNSNIINQDARSAEFGGPNGEVQRGVFMLGNDNIEMPNGTYAEMDTINSVVDNYAKATRKEGNEPIASGETSMSPGQSSLPPEHILENLETEVTPDKDLHQAALNLAELYAKSRRLIAGPGVREKFESARQEYQRLLTEHLSSMGRARYGAEFKSFSSDMQTMVDELAAENVKELTDYAGGDLEYSLKTPEEIETKREELRRTAEAKMKEQYPDMVNNLETTVTSDVIEEYAKLRVELEEATIDALDNGTACRRAVSKIITNKGVKQGLLAASAVGLAIAAVGIGHGVADGSLAVSVGYTAGGIAAGALRGGLVGALMSRQSSKTSAIRNYGGDVVESVQNRVKAGEHITAEGLATEAMSDYAAANQTDLRNNRVKTVLSTGVGATIGAAVSGIHVDNIVHSNAAEQVQTGVTTKQVQTGTKIDKVQTGTISGQIQVGTTPEHYDLNLARIDVAPGSGIGETFTDLGGDPSRITEAVRIANEFDARYGMVPGSNGVTAGVNGQVGQFAHTYPGTIDTWPTQAREYIIQVAQKWAENGLIDGAKIGGEPIYETIEIPAYSLVETPIYSTTEVPIYSVVEKTVISYLPNLFYNALVQAEAAVVSGNIGGIEVGHP